MRSSTTSLNGNIDNMVMNRFSTQNILPKTKNTQTKHAEEINFNYTPNSQDVNKNNLKILKNKRAIEQITKNKSNDDRKRLSKFEGENLHPSSEIHSKKAMVQYESTSKNYNNEELQAFNPTMPIRGSYRIMNENTLPQIPPKQRGSQQDIQKKKSKKVTINTDDVKIQHIQKENILNISSKQTQEKLTDKKNISDISNDIQSSNFYQNMETNAEKQSRIDGQVKRYMEKIGLKKKDKFPVFYTLDENGNEVKTSLSNPQMYQKFTNQQQPYLLQQKNNTISQKQTNHMNETKQKKLSRAGQSEDKLPTQNENLDDIIKICSEFQKTISNFDKKNQKSARRNQNEFRKLSNHMKQIDIQNLIIQESDDPALQPYFQNLKQSGRIKEPRIKDLLDS
ncbi:hypothetical protein TTHERM_00456920 (macronuclear) [Tetrahymena thermophila SB210]|uniref:Uncharacterized protein n=1 Tax=Tetrahymena thermophila (strain SB210) TaxID=312017 RepID=I7MI75_TETTS|nr:hypothetical protein TTHERM_00456920 [Tetrahymena thermophila SB210]EAS03954.4 hypothetical protein TTHERM_00456920 [Tetrahymena thermophila SB210]|eukprot:XP_001024199.4 hypothetical protein TTHERM_00456920 [Tetrahymena thermophila SB210]